jgi:beta-mannanase
VVINFGHEMNGTWYPWCGLKNGDAQTTGYGDPTRPDGPERYVDAFRHVRNLFNAVGANNVIWAWSPNEGNPVGEAWNDVENYYPGAEYVEWLGMTGYNWGAARPWSQWRSFDAIFGDLYRRLVALAPDKPIIIAEFASSESGGDKSQWVTDAFRRIKEAYPLIKAFVWFDIVKETDWAIDSSSESLEAFRQAMRDPYYLGELQLKEGP